MSDATPALHSPRKEITLRVVILGLLLSVVMGAANVYIGLKAGMTVAASIPAAVMAMLLFKALFRNSSILEANQVQTCASAGESLAAGIIFTMPAMILIGYWQDFDFWTVTVIAMTGGLLGILFMIPMRKVFISGDSELAYPEAIACAAVLQAGNGETRTGEGRALLLGGITGAVVALGNKLFGVLVTTLEGATSVGQRVFYIGGDLSPLLIAIGFIVRLNVAVLIFLGGALSWLIGIPLITSEGPILNPLDTAYDIWSSQIRYVGVGAMVVGGFASLVTVRHGLVSAIRELKANMAPDKVRENDLARDIPAGLILGLGLICMVVLGLINYRFTGGITIAVIASLVMFVLGFFFSAVASYIVGLVGSSNSPVSGMTITAVLVAGGILWLFNYSGMQAMVATLGIAAIVCCVACTSGDVSNDLKTGLIVGAAPFRQQYMQMAGVVVAAFVMSPVMSLLHNNVEGGIGGRELSAPQASLFAALARGFSGESELPWHLLGFGAVVGVIILIIDRLLQRKGSTFRAHLMPIAVGMYLPFGLAIPILIGGIIAHLHSRAHPKARHDVVLHKGVLFSSGVIAGEALTSVGLAGAVAMGVQNLNPGGPSMLLSGLVALGLIGIFYQQSRHGHHP